LVAVDVVPSPKFQLREAMVPSLSVELSVKFAVRPLVVKLKFAVGATLPPPPPAASTTFFASRMPGPMVWLGVTGNGRKFALIRLSTWAGVFGVGDTDCNSAITPATCGVAIEVPL